MDIKKVESFRKGKALVLHGLQERLISGITDEDIRKTDFKSRLISFGVAFDKTQSVENKPTANLAAQFSEINLDMVAPPDPEMIRETIDITPSQEEKDITPPTNEGGE